VQKKLQIVQNINQENASKMRQQIQRNGEAENFITLSETQQTT
jgi:hypothetical protein